MKKNLEAKIMMQLNAGAMKAVFDKKELIQSIAINKVEKGYAAEKLLEIFNDGAMLTAE